MVVMVVPPVSFGRSEAASVVPLVSRCAATVLSVVPLVSCAGGEVVALGGAASDFFRAREIRGTSAGVFLGRCETGGTSVSG